MPFIVGTAGHIDHGKTSLIKALTGQDTDRLKEEKERGISIDLGFAHLDLPDGTRVGVVDVPGHERFIRNMLAGAHGIDLVLFTVAADDGVMPQTIEHLDILHVLGVTRAIFVMTKVDIATPSRILEVEEEIQILAAGTSLESAPIVGFSAATGEGLETLRRQIASALHAVEAVRPSGYFRLPVDRVFVLQGHGAVVTGTALQGEVRTGDRLRCLPGDQQLRVRSLQVHGESVSSASAGQRVALNLAGQDTPGIERGHVLCHEQLALTSDRFDASFAVRPSAERGLESHQRVRVHLGTAERLGKVIVLGSERLVPPGHGGFCQVVLSEPVAALRGDRFVIRDETAQRTLGGGIVIHPWARPHTRREQGLELKLHTLREGGANDVAALLIDEHDDFAIPLTVVGQFLNLLTEDARKIVLSAQAIRTVSLEGEDLFTTHRKWSRLAEVLLAALREFHATHPLALGADMEELRAGLPSRIPPRLFRGFVDQLEHEHVIAREGSLLRLPGHRIALPDQEQRTLARITALLEVNPLSPPTLSHIEHETGIGRATLIGCLRLLERAGTVRQVNKDLYFAQRSIEDVVRTLRGELSGGDEITPAMFRDRFNTSRKYAIPLLEYLDREGVTVRVGDARRLRTSRPSA
jgi:selenocysteine-specific elongation factor